MDEGSVLVCSVKAYWKIESRISGGMRPLKSGQSFWGLTARGRSWIGTGLTKIGLGAVTACSGCECG
jgi:hypothetical protein